MHAYTHKPFQGDMTYYVGIFSPKNGLILPLIFKSSPPDANFYSLFFHDVTCQNPEPPGF